MSDPGQVVSAFRSPPFLEGILVVLDQKTELVKDGSTTWRM
jgi:hypothetical protein